jgi:hypothetical protein
LYFGYHACFLGAEYQRFTPQVSDINIAGDNAALVLNPLQDGGIQYAPLPGDLVRTTHDKPQVTVAVNGIPSRCAGDCTFEWVAGLAPAITSASPSSGVAGNTLSVVGTGFGTDTAAIAVTIADVPCAVSSLTDTLIECTLGEGRSEIVMWRI